MNQPIRIGMDPSKRLFRLQEVDARERVVLRRRLKRDQAIDARMRAWLAAKPTAVRLRAIPGVGPLIAAMLAMKSPDPHRFTGARDLRHLNGLDPQRPLHGRTAAVRMHHPGGRSDAALAMTVACDRT